MDPPGPDGENLTLAPYVPPTMGPGGSGMRNGALPTPPAARRERSIIREREERERDMERDSMSPYQERGMIVNGATFPSHPPPPHPHLHAHSSRGNSYSGPSSSSHEVSWERPYQEENRLPPIKTREEREEMDRERERWGDKWQRQDMWGRPHYWKAGDAYYTNAPPAVNVRPPELPREEDLENVEHRLKFTLHCIAYLFRTQYRGQNDMDLEVLMHYMNEQFSREEFKIEELTKLVTMLKNRHKLTFVGGGLQLIEDPYAEGE